MGYDEVTITGLGRSELYLICLFDLENDAGGRNNQPCGGSPQPCSIGPAALQVQGSERTRAIPPKFLHTPNRSILPACDDDDTTILTRQYSAHKDTVAL